MMILRLKKNNNIDFYRIVFHLRENNFEDELNTRALRVTDFSPNHCYDLLFT